ncbi:MAG: protease pro-enzyme activation domain-containing protein, partial [Solirubrobacteraceae bacterium]
MWVLVGAAALGAGVVPSASAAVARMRVGEIARLPANARIAGTTPAATALALTVMLQPRDPAALRAFATAVSTPGSALYHHYLTVAQFAARFGATRTRIRAVERALAAEGLTVGRPAANDLTLPVQGGAGRVEHALSVSLAQVRIGGRTAYANQQAPALPSAIARYVQGVIGLDDLTPDQPAGLAGPGAGA